MVRLGATCLRLNGLAKEEILWESLVRIHLPEAFAQGLLPVDDGESQPSVNKPSVELKVYFGEGSVGDPCSSWRETFRSEMERKIRDKRIMNRAESMINMMRNHHQQLLATGLMTEEEIMEEQLMNEYQELQDED